MSGVYGERSFAKQLAVNHVVLMVMRRGSNYWPGATWILAARVCTPRTCDETGATGPGHATFAGNVDFGGAGLHTARTCGEAAGVCAQRARAVKRQGSAQHARAVK